MPIIDDKNLESQGAGTEVPPHKTEFSPQRDGTRISSEADFGAADEHVEPEPSYSAHDPFAEEAPPSLSAFDPFAEGPSATTSDQEDDASSEDPFGGEQGSGPQVETDSRLDVVALSASAEQLPNDEHSVENFADPESDPDVESGVDVNEPLFNLHAEHSAQRMDIDSVREGSVSPWEAENESGGEFYSQDQEERYGSTQAQPVDAEQQASGPELTISESEMLEFSRRSSEEESPDSDEETLMFADRSAAQAEPSAQSEDSSQDSFADSEDHSASSFGALVARAADKGEVSDDDGHAETVDSDEVVAIIESRNTRTRRVLLTQEEFGLAEKQLLEGRQVHISGKALVLDAVAITREIREQSRRRRRRA